MSKLLELAKAVYPSDLESFVLIGGVPYGKIVGRFDPENNDSQAWDVLAWLTRQTCIDWHKPDCNAIGGEHQLVLCDFDGATFNHDGTASGIRKAVVEAAKEV